MSSYRNDPYWITVKYPATCSSARCGEHGPASIARGAKAFYYPKGKFLLCARCGESAALEFAAMAQDEEAYSYGC